MIDYTHPSIAHLKKDVQRYMQQRGQAKKRGIDFLLSFQEWYDWWQQTGHYNERGAKRHQYVMARYNDSGPYALNNIKCITMSENVKECVTTDSFKAVLKEAHAGTHVKEQRETIQAATGLPETDKIKRPKKPRPPKFSELSVEEQYFIRREAGLKAAETRRERNTGVQPGYKHKDNSNYKGRTPWHAGKKLGPRDPAVVERVRQAVIASIQRKKEKLNGKADQNV